MNRVTLIGRLARDPELRYTASAQMAVCRLVVAVDRPTRKDEEKQADFIDIKVFGKQAEACNDWLIKGAQVGVDGALRKSSYENKDGQKVFFTEVVAAHVEFLNKVVAPESNEAPPNFEDIGEDIPF